MESISNLWLASSRLATVLLLVCGVKNQIADEVGSYR